MSNACEICDGTGWYPIHNRGGRQVYSIACPEGCRSPESLDTPPSGSPRTKGGNIDGTKGD